MLCNACAARLYDVRSVTTVNAAAAEAWRQSTAEIERLLRAAETALPNAYAGTLRYATQ